MSEVEDTVDEVVVHKYDKFRHPNGDAYAFLEVPIAFLEEDMPLDANWATFKDEEVDPVVKNLGAYTLTKVYSLDNTTAVIRLAAMQANTYRTPNMTYDDLQDWETWLDDKGYTIENFLTIEEYKALLATEAYSDD